MKDGEDKAQLAIHEETEGLGNVVVLIGGDSVRREGRREQERRRTLEQVNAWPAVIYMPNAESEVPTDDGVRASTSAEL